jgi:hypothetical protein
LSFAGLALFAHAPLPITTTAPCSVPFSFFLLPRLRKISAGEQDTEQMGDASTLADPGVLKRLIDSKPSTK